MGREAIMQFVGERTQFIHSRSTLAAGLYKRPARRRPLLTRFPILPGPVAAGLLRAPPPPRGRAHRGEHRLLRGEDPAAPSLLQRGRGAQSPGAGVGADQQLLVLVLPRPPRLRRLRLQPRRPRLLLHQDARPVLHLVPARRDLLQAVHRLQGEVAQELNRGRRAKVPDLSRGPRLERLEDHLVAASAADGASGRPVPPSCGPEVLL